MRRALSALFFLFLAAPMVAGSPAPSTQAAPAAQTPVAQAPVAQAPGAGLDAGKVGDEIDPSIHWLRGAQDAKDGSWGGVLATAQALRAMAESPRRYVPADGPFVQRGVAYLSARQRSDGSIADEGAAAEAVRDQTAASAAALAALPAGSADDTLKRALGFLGSLQAAPAWRAEAEPADAAAARAQAARLLGLRRPDGSWKDERGERLATVAGVLELNACWRVLKKEKGSAAAPTAKPLPAFDPADRTRAEQALRRGAAFLVGRAKNGAWGRGAEPDAGITAMAVAGLLAVPSPRPPEVERAMGQGLDWLVARFQSGAIQATGLANYVTSAMVMSLVAAGREQDRAIVEQARALLQALQADEQEGYSPSDKYYGGIGYGNDQRPDLSNLNMALGALAASGLEQGDPTFKKALVFLQRCQNRSESNDLVVADGAASVVSGNDGGAAYAPGESKAGLIDIGGGKKVARSYGSMTYALLRCYLFAGIDRADPRAQAVWDWLSKNYTLDVNPGFESSADPQAPYQGLFYYFLTMAQALDAHGTEQITDAAGVAHSWRQELAGRLVSMQRQDGSWVNENSPRWWEGDPVLCTGYALAALGLCLPAK